MGSWSISIHGHGIHDNGKDGDVDQLMQQFISDLKQKGGHVIDSAHLTIGAGRKYPVGGTSSDYTRIEYF